jgi:hypothetical protein
MATVATTPPINQPFSRPHILVSFHPHLSCRRQHQLQLSLRRDHQHRENQQAHRCGTVTSVVECVCVWVWVHVSVCVFLFYPRVCLFYTLGEARLCARAFALSLFRGRDWQSVLARRQQMNCAMLGVVCLGFCWPSLE